MQAPSKLEQSNAMVLWNPTMEVQGGEGTLKNPQYNVQMHSGAIVYPQEVRPAPVVAEYGRNLSILTPVGVNARENSNPISRYNFAIELYEYDYNIIKGIDLLSIPICCPVAYLYDFLIYFYEGFFQTLTCTHPSGRSICWNMLILAIYVLILIGPYISIVQLIITSTFFIFYIIGVVISCINKSRLSGHEFTQNMVPSSSIPFFPKEYLNQIYELTNEMVRAYIYAHPNITYFQAIIANHKAKFMAYTQDFLDLRYNYINSCKMIAFHITFTIFSILGLVVSVAAFPVLYGKQAPSTPSSQTSY